MLTVKYPKIKNCKLVSFNLEQRRTNSPIPTSYNTGVNASLIVSSFKTGNFVSSGGLLYRNSYEKMPQNGSNLSSLLYSAFTLPSVQQIDISDRNKNDYLMAYASTKYTHKKIETNASVSFDRQWSDNRFIPSFLAYPHHIRVENIRNLVVATDFSYNINRSFTIMPFSYRFVQTDNQVNTEGSQENKNRNAQEIKYSVKFNFDNDNQYVVELDNRHYFSNTLSSYTNIFPGIGFNLKVFDTNWLSNYWLWWHELSLRGSLKRSIGEAPLFYRNTAVLSTVYEANNFQNYLYYGQLFSHHKDLKAEIFTNWNIGFVYEIRSILTIEANYFNNRTKDYILTVFVSSELRYILENVGEMQNSGHEISLKFFNWFGSSRLNSQLNFSRSRSKVLDVYGSDPIIPVAGFSDIAIVFAENESVGAIYDMKLNKKIGDATPNYTISFTSSASWRHLEFGAAMEYNRGGQRWNGTRGFLNFIDDKAPFTEKYIEDASYFRLSDIRLSYSFNLAKHKNSKIRAAISARNLLLITKYKGVDPASTLFGHSAATGLDLFNQPSIRTYSFIVSFRY
jgi:hypothetical protein